MAEDHKARGPLTSAVGRLAFTVREVVVSRDSVQADEDLENRLDAVVGKPLTPEGVIGIALRVARRPPRGATGIRLRPDRAGVVVNVTLTKRAVHVEGSQKGWSTTSSVSVGGENLHNSSGKSTRKHGREREAYEDIEKALVKALSARPDEDFALRLSLIEEE